MSHLPFGAAGCKESYPFCYAMRLYAVEGLGFYYINTLVQSKNKSENKSAVIRVTGGSLTSANVTSEIERLFPGGWQWKVEEIGVDTFRTMFPTRAELQRMVEWGVLHTKFPGITLRFEEGADGGEVKYTMPKVWVQFTGLPKELREFVIIWVVGSILGVSKAVDMKFTRKHDICRLQVLVLDPNLIPQFVDVVIGNFLYGLQFRVEENIDENNPEPMDMDFGFNDIGGENEGDDHNRTMHQLMVARARM